MSSLDRPEPDIRPLTGLQPEAYRRIATGYTSPAKYAVHKEESPERTTITIERQPLAAPYVKRWPNSDRDLASYAQIVAEEDASLGAYDGERLVGVIIAKVTPGNGTLWVWDLEVDEAWRGHGIGRRLVEQLAAIGTERGLRVMLVDVQNTNANAIAFYYRTGFVRDGLDLSHYSNHDVTQGEVAFFMKRYLA
jgi:ribosomal protein S18 acetylase RimI-like enzyme